MKRALIVLGICAFVAACSSDDSDDGSSSAAGSAGQAGSAGSAAGAGGSQAGAGGSQAGSSGEAGAAGSTAGAAGEAGAAGQSFDAGPDAPPLEGGIGACTNDADKAIVADMGKVMDVTIQCGIKNMGADPGTANCIATDTGMSQECAACFGVAVKCMMDHCIAACSTDPKSASCTDCQKQYCNADLAQCSGIPLP